MKLLFDTNVVLDLLLDREPWSQAAAQLFAWVEQGRVEGYLGATTVTTLHYLTRKVMGAEEARRHIESLLTLCDVAPVNRAVLDRALALELRDFEDAVLQEAALQVGVEAIVTRNPRDFATGTVRILTPPECGEVLKQRATLSSS